MKKPSTPLIVPILVFLFLFTYWTTLVVLASTSFGLWIPKGNIIANSMCGTGGTCANPSVIYRATGCLVLSSPCHGLWVFNEGGLPAVQGIYYFESADGFTSWSAYSGNPMILDNGTGNTRFPVVSLQAGTFYIFAGSGTSINEWTSPNGVTSLTSIGSILARGNAGSWEAGGIFQLNIIDTIAGTTTAYYTGWNGSSNRSYAQGCATTTNLTCWTKCSGNPIFNGLGNTPIGATTFYKQAGTYYAYTSGYTPNAELQTLGFESFFRFSSPSVTGPWTELTYGSTGIQIPIYYANTPFDFNNGGCPAASAQVGDPELEFPPDGSIHLYYDSTCDFGVELGVSAAVIPHANLSQIVASYEGVFNVPVSGFPQLNLLTLASDSGTGPNSNPIGGNWTPLAVSGAFGTAQRISNRFESSSTAAPNSDSYWNAFTWPADQWSQSTVCVNNGEFTGADSRMSTSGAITAYRMFWTGTLGSSGTNEIQKEVSGSATTIFSNTGLPLNVGDTIMNATIGSLIYFYYDGYLIGSVSDSANATGAAGFQIASGPSNVSNAAICGWSGGMFQSVSGSIGGKAGIGGKAAIGQ